MRNHWVLLAILTCSLVFPDALRASETAETLSVRQRLENQISDELHEVQKSGKLPPPEFCSQIAVPPCRRMPPAEWKRELDEQQKKLTNLRELIQNTPDEQLPDVLAGRFLNQGKYVNQYPPLTPYIMALGERIVPPFAGKFDQAGPRTKEDILLILGNIHSKKALPVVRKALEDSNQRVILAAQTALRLILNLEARPELEQMLIATKSSWALTHTLREISLTGDQSWYEDFFRLAQSRKLSLYDLALIGNPDDCPEAVIGANLDFLVNVIVSQDDPDIHPSDMRGPGEFLLYLKETGGRKSPLTKTVASNFYPQLLEFLKSADATELTGQHEEAIVAAFNRTKDNVRLYPENSSRIELKDPVLKEMLNDLAGRGIFVRTAANGWSVKDRLTADEQKSVAWFNVCLLSREFPLVLSKDKYGRGEQAVARRMLTKLTQRDYLRRIYPLLPKILQDRYRRGGKMESFGARVTPLSGQPPGFSDDEADLILKNIASGLSAEDIEEWRQKGAADFLTQTFLQDLLAQKRGTTVDFQGRDFSLRITARDESGRSLASSVFRLKYEQEEDIVLPSDNSDSPEHHIKLKVQLDRDQWLFHLDLLVDLKPHGAGFDIYIPVAGRNETPLTETVAGKTEKIVWTFEHLDED